MSARCLASTRDNAGRLGIINAMLQKRICQADFVRDVASRIRRLHLCFGLFKLMRHWTSFEDIFDRRSRWSRLLLWTTTPSWKRIWKSSVRVHILPFA
jgi:hypothetical protein